MKLSAFVLERLITNNAMVAFELFYFMKYRLKGRKGVTAIKLDMNKAYDHMEWGYLAQVMHKMTFPNHFMNLIMTCLYFISFSFSH